ncbi:lipase family protein [Fictibacillus sp. 26RED30]|uniref:lipase family protein n=1 Tax=Fictibacillus sp. 26RED30 TaxID=2745877 RepID=UPI0018CDF976|nr:lipase family protein [Fictibacillus sp. 26RED30]MBH0161567.1 lipase family protein [Fictibacillus sp. 26RED30]
MKITKELFVFDGEMALFLAVMSYKAYIVHELSTIELPKHYEMKRAIVSDSGETFGFIAESEDSLVVAFRGTKTIDNVSSYLDVSQVPYIYVTDSGLTHRGITKIYSTFRDALLADINQLYTGDKQLLVTGHSLGGSLAALFTLDAAVNTNFINPILYSFASLPIANEDFTKKFYEEVINSIRVVNVHDAISNCMTPLFFKNKPLLNLPIGQEYQLNFKNRKYIQNHRILCYIHFLSKQYPIEYKKLCNKYPGFFPESTICE